MSSERPGRSADCSAGCSKRGAQLVGRAERRVLDDAGGVGYVDVQRFAAHVGPARRQPLAALDAGLPLAGAAWRTGISMLPTSRKGRGLRRWRSIRLLTVLVASGLTTMS